VSKSHWLILKFQSHLFLHFQAYHLERNFYIIKTIIFLNYNLADAFSFLDNIIFSFEGIIFTSNSNETFNNFIGRFIFKLSNYFFIFSII
jgi:hypothetical protein